MWGYRRAVFWVPFVFHVNNLSTSINDLNVILTNYADDTNILIAEQYDDTLCLKTINTVNRIDVWFKKKTLLLNTGKANCVLFRFSRNMSVFPNILNMNNTIVTY